MTITPVQLSGNEIYEILKKRLIDELPDEQTISDVAENTLNKLKRQKTADTSLHPVLSKSPNRSERPTLPPIVQALGCAI